MKHISVRFSLVDSLGNWWAIGEPESEESETVDEVEVDDTTPAEDRTENPFRTKPDLHKVEEVFQAAATAATYMPHLRSLEVGIGHASSFPAMEFQARDPRRQDQRPSLLFHLFSPSKTLVDMWRKVTEDLTRQL